jgi:hypothetical protein
MKFFAGLKGHLDRYAKTDFVYTALFDTLSRFAIAFKLSPSWRRRPTSSIIVRLEGNNLSLREGPPK